MSERHDGFRFQPCLPGFGGVIAQPILQAPARIRSFLAPRRLTNTAVSTEARSQPFLQARSTLTRLSALVAIGLLGASAIPSRAESPMPSSVTAISPVFGQLVRFSMPAQFVAAFENTEENFYIREAVPRGETVTAWTQMITVTGSRGMATSANFSPQKLAAAIAQGFKKACPESFAVKDLGQTTLGGRDGYLAVASCGKVNSSADGHSETALIVAVKGTADAYTIQWAERTPHTSLPPGIDEAIWRQRLAELMPIRLCAIVPGEAAPYPSCLQQK
jgi:hypothetical protein